MKRIMNIGLGFVFAFSTTLLALPAGAQTPSQAKDQSSLGDYARKVNKTTNSPKAKPKIYDNDNLPTDDKISVVGPPPSNTVADAAPANASDKPQAPADPKAPADTKAGSAEKPAAPADDEKAKKEAAWKEWQDKLSAQKNQIDLASRELDVTQREYQLRAAAMYADTGNRLRNETQWDKQDAQYKQQIVDKQKAVDDAKQKLSDMQDAAHKSGVPSSMID